MFPPRPGWGLGRRLSRKQGEPRTRRCCTLRAVASNSESGARRGATPFHPVPHTRWSRGAGPAARGRAWTPAGLGAESAGQEGGTPAAPTLATRPTPGHLPPCLARLFGAGCPRSRWPPVPLGSGAAASRASVGPPRPPGLPLPLARLRAPAPPGGGACGRRGAPGVGSAGAPRREGCGRAGHGHPRWPCPALPWPGQAGPALGALSLLAGFWAGTGQVYLAARPICKGWRGPPSVQSPSAHRQAEEAQGCAILVQPATPWCLFRAGNGSERALAKVKAARGRGQPMTPGAFEHMKDWKTVEEEEENVPSRLQQL